MAKPISPSNSVGVTFTARRRRRGAARRRPAGRARASSSRSSAIPAAASPPCSTSSPACCRPPTGAVILDGTAVDAPGPERAVVFQNHSLLPWLTVYENVRLAVDKVFGGTKSRRRAPRLDAAQPGLVQMAHAKDKRPARDLRRHEAARRHRPRPGHGAQGAAAGRAVRRAGRADPRPPAGQRDGDPRQARQHRADDHPRRRRGGAAVRPHRDDDQRPGRRPSARSSRSPCRGRATRLELAADPVFVAARTAVLEFLHARHANPALSAA